MFPLHMTADKLKIGDRFKYMDVWYTIATIELRDETAKIVTLENRTLVLENEERIQVKIKGLLS